MASQHRDYEHYRRGGRREWNDEGQPSSRERWSMTPSRSWRSQGDGDSYTDDGNRFGGQPSGYGRGTDFGGRGSELDAPGPFEARGYGDYEHDRDFSGYRGDRAGGGYRREGPGSSERGRSWQENDAWQQSPGRSFGGQSSYARDLYSDSGANRHETDWESGNAGRGLQGVYSRGGFAGRGPKDYQRSDERIREEICDRMTDDDSLDASDVTVQVRQGEVTLSGTVRNRGDKRRAEDLAESISGTREVTNNLRLSRDQNGADLTQGASIQVGPSGQSGQGSKTKSGASGSPASSHS